MTELPRQEAEKFSSSRSFQMWAFTTSHAQLLLRSPKAEGEPTRIDVLFKNVHRLNLPSCMEGLTIEKAGDRLYRLGGSGWSGEVDAGLVAVAEDTLDFMDPSPLYLGGVGGT